MNEKTEFQVAGQTVTVENVAYLLCNAFEGGSNYWYMIEKSIDPEEAGGTRSRPIGDDSPRYIDFPLSPGGALLISDRVGCHPNRPQVRRLDIGIIEKGLQIMKEKFPRHWTDFIEDTADAETGDVFLQCCLFEDLVYG